MRFIAVTLAFGAIASTGFVRGNAAFAPKHQFAADVVHASNFGTDDCTLCGNCPAEGYHDIGGNGPDRQYAEPAGHTCSSEYASGTCPNRHPESSLCSGGGGVGTLFVAAASPQDLKRLESLRQFVTSETANSPAGKLAIGSNRIMLNVARHAVQVIDGCSGQVAVSIPVTDAQIEVLTH